MANGGANLVGFVRGAGGARRQGVGRIKHLDVAMLWLQEKVRNGQVEVGKVKGEGSPADVATKPKTVGQAMGLLRSVGIQRKEENGR